MAREKEEASVVNFERNYAKTHSTHISFWSKMLYHYCLSTAIKNKPL
jgi:hypothetical protein